MKTENSEKQNERQSGSNEASLIAEVEELTEEMRKQNSRKYIFFNGIVRGLGYAVGATILFGLLITILGFIVSRSDASWVESLVGWLGLDEYINQ